MDDGEPDHRRAGRAHRGRGEDVVPLLSEIARHRGMRIAHVIPVIREDQPVCVAQVSGNAAERTLDDIWRARLRVVHVAQLPLR